MKDSRSNYTVVEILLECNNDDVMLVEARAKKKKSGKSGCARQQCLVATIRKDKKRLHLCERQQSLSKHNDDNQEMRKDSQKAGEAALSGKL